MRTLELALVLLCAAFTIRVATAGRSASWTHAGRWILSTALIAQIVIEGWRWQMFPAYAGTLIVAVATPTLIEAGALLATSIVCCLILPFVQTPVPHGPFSVGVAPLPVTVTRPPEAVQDELRALPYAKLWYPAQPVSANPATRLRNFLKSRATDLFSAKPTQRARPDAPIESGRARFPVVVYFDGWPEDEIHNVNLIVELVSHGFAVASVQYPAKSPGMSEATYALLRAQMARDVVGYESDTAFGRSVELNHARAHIHAQDAIAVLDELASCDTNTASRFAGRLDTTRAGTLGFSFGGAIAAAASRLDSRIKAVVSMDGRHWSEPLYKGVARPYLLIGEVLPMPTAADLTSPNGYIRYEAMLDQVDFPNMEANMKALGGIHATVAGAAHMNFTDVALRSPLRRFSDGGTIRAARAQEIVQTYVVEFFERYLLSAEPPPLETPWRQFPEVHLKVYPAPRNGAQLSVRPPAASAATE